LVGRWLDRLFELFSGSAPADRGQGLDSNTISTWSVPTWLVIVALLLTLAIAAYACLRDASRLRRKWLLVAVRSCLIVLVVFMMHGWIRYQYRTNLPDLLLLIDDSQSMQASDYYSDQSLDRMLRAMLKKNNHIAATRINLLKSILLEDEASLLQRLRSRYNIRLYLIGRSARRITGDAAESIRDFQPSEPASRLGDGLRQVLQLQRGRPTAAVVFFTDGNNTAGTPISRIAEYAKQRSIPLLLFGMGSESLPTDLRVSDVLTPAAAFVDDLVHFDTQITAEGRYPANFQARVTLSQKGSSKPLDEKRISIPPTGTSTNVRLSHRPGEARKWQYTVRIEPVANEADTTNNHRSLVVDVRDETIRVLLVQEYPSPEFRFLKTILSRQTQRGSRNKAISLTTVLQEADLEYVDQDDTAQRTLPLDRKELFRYDVIIFGDVNRRSVSDDQLAHLAAFVDVRGGGLLVIAGQRHTPHQYRGTPLGRILPIRLTNLIKPDPAADLTKGVQVQPTNLGLVSPPFQLGDTDQETVKIWERFPPVYWYLQAPDLRPAARVLAQHPSHITTSGQRLPLISMQVVGAGKVIFHSIDSSYRWSRSDDGPEFFERYWLQTIRYLSRRQLLGRSRRVILNSPQDRYRVGDEVRLQARFLDDGLTPTKDDGVQVAIQRTNGLKRLIRLTRHPINRNAFGGQIGNLTIGTYRAWLVSPALKERPPVYSFQVIRRQGEDRKKHMAVQELKLAAKKSSGTFLTVRDKDSLESSLPPGKQVRIESLPPKSVWNSPVFATLFVVLLVGEWLIRKQGGLS